MMFWNQNIKIDIKLVYTDTDSYVIKVETDDLYEDFKEINEYMDFSDYPCRTSKLW